jgi:hypothetical protein
MEICGRIKAHSNGQHKHGRQRSAEPTDKLPGLIPLFPTFFYEGRLFSNLTLHDAQMSATYLFLANFHQKICPCGAGRNRAGKCKHRDSDLRRTDKKDFLSVGCHFPENIGYVFVLP